MTEDSRDDSSIRGKVTGQANGAANLNAERTDYIRRIFRRHSGDPNATGPGPVADISGVLQTLLNHATAGSAVPPEAAAMLAGSLFAALAIIRPQLSAWEETHAEALEQMALMDARVPPVPNTAMSARHAMRSQGKM